MQIPSRSQVFFILILPLFFVGPHLRAQETEPPDWDYSTFSGGVGASLGGTAITLKLQNFFFGGVERVTSSPVYAGTFDMRLNKVFGFGAAYSHQTFETRSSSFNGASGQVETNSDYYKRQNYGLRALLFMGNNRKMDMYWAFRPGYTFWDHTSSSSDESYIKSMEMPDAISMQLAYGMRFYLGKLGFGFEVGIGSAPYLALANVCIKFD